MSYIYSKVGFSDFINAFNSAGRGDQFTHHGLVMLYDHLIELAADLSEPIELDVIALCCEYSEYSKDSLLIDFNHVEELEQAEIDNCGYTEFNEIADILQSGGIDVVAYSDNNDCILIRG